jgi:hypothetical protein
LPRSRFWEVHLLKLFSFCGGLLLLAIGPASCGGNFSAVREAEGQSLTSSVTDRASLINKLRAAGASVKVVGEVDQPFLSVTGTMIKLRGEDVQVFQYSSAKEMEAQAALISRDGTAVGTRKIHWIGSPHFFKQGRVLVLYVGQDTKVEKALEAVLGPQFAGQ